jgi:hypothetical protein
MRNSGRGDRAELNDTENLSLIYTEFRLSDRYLTDQLLVRLYKLEGYLSCKGLHEISV